MNIIQQEHVEEQIIENGVPLVDMKYDVIKQNDDVLIQGHYNNKRFRYRKTPSKPNVQFEQPPLIPMNIESMPYSSLHPNDSIELTKIKRMKLKPKKRTKKIREGSQKHLKNIESKSKSKSNKNIRRYKSRSTIKTKK